MSNVTKPATPAAVSDAANGHTMLPEQVAADGASAEPGGAALAAGTMVSDRYRIVRVLGEGGMGVVYAAEHVHMRKEVALKVLHAEMCTMPEVVARFEREAIAAAHIDHPNVAAATDFGRLEDGACFLVLELLRGSSLRDEISKGPIPLERALRLLRGIVSGVAAAHAKGIVHRDLKPENVMVLDRDGTTDFVKVLDFGIAKVDSSLSAGPSGVGKALTRVGSVFGTPEYMAPEQAIGDAVDARADLYALGVIFLEMLTGKCPFTGNALSILRERILAEGPPDMSTISDPGPRALIARLLTRQPADRMQTATDLLAAIDALASESRGELPMRGSIVSSIANAGTPSLVAATTATTSLAPPASPLRFRIAAVAAAALLVGGLAAVALTRSGTTAKDATAAPAKDPIPAASSASVAPSASAAAVDPASDDDPPTPTPSASASPARPAAKTTKPATKGTKPPRKTGPGGVYIPPPKDWFK